jgi:hypothetical protein
MRFSAGGALSCDDISFGDISLAEHGGFLFHVCMYYLMWELFPGCQGGYGVIIMKDISHKAAYETQINGRNWGV